MDSRVTGATWTLRRWRATAATATTVAGGFAAAVSESRCLAMNEVSSSAATKAGCLARRFRNSTFVGKPLT